MLTERSLSLVAVMANKDTRQTILETASQLFASRGYASVSMRDVAAAVGVTPANIYHHFADKDQLVRESLSYVFSKRTNEFEEIFQSGDDSFDGLEKMVSWFLDILENDDVFARLLFREFLEGDPGRIEFLTKSVFLRPFLTVCDIAAARDGGKDPVLSALSIVGLVLGHRQLSVLLPHLPGGEAKHRDRAVVTRHVLAVLRGAFADSPPDGGR